MKRQPRFKLVISKPRKVRSVMEFYEWFDRLPKEEKDKIIRKEMEFLVYMDKMGLKPASPKCLTQSLPDFLKLENL